MFAAIPIGFSLFSLYLGYLHYLGYLKKKAIPVYNKIG
jgi:hypothetical protein